MASTSRASTSRKSTKTNAGKRNAPRRRQPTEEAIARRAYDIYLAEGGGNHVDHWLRAERELASA